MTSSRSEVCASWAAADQVSGLDAPIDDDLLRRCLFMASDVLYNFTKQRWPGECVDKIRPCTAVRGSAPVDWRYGDAWMQNALTGIRYGRCGAETNRPCACGVRDEIELPQLPVNSIVAVKIDGVAVDPANYRLRDRRVLMAVGDQRWPRCQHLALDDTEVGTFSVEYRFGVAPPIGGEMSCLALGRELYLSFQPDQKKCRLPKRVQTISRQGVSIAAVIDPLTLFEKGQTGLAEVDMWVGSVNRGANTRGATVVDPVRASTHPRVS